MHTWIGLSPQDLASKVHLSQKGGLINSAHCLCLHTLRNWRQGPNHPNQTGLASPGRPQDSILCSNGRWEGCSGHSDAPRNPIPPSFLGPEMLVVLLWGSRPPLDLPDQFWLKVAGWEAERKNRAAGAGAGKGILGPNTPWVKPCSPSGWPRDLAQVTQISSLANVDNERLFSETDEAQNIEPGAEEMPPMDVEGL